MLHSKDIEEAIAFLARHLQKSPESLVFKGAYYQVSSPNGYAIKRDWNGIFECDGAYYTSAVYRPASYAEIDQEKANEIIALSNKIRTNSASTEPCPDGFGWVSAEFIKNRAEELINMSSAMQCCMGGEGGYYHPQRGMTLYERGDRIVINLHLQDHRFNKDHIAFIKSL